MLHQYAHIKSLKSQPRESQRKRRKKTLLFHFFRLELSPVLGVGSGCHRGVWSVNPSSEGPGEIQREKTSHQFTAGNVFHSE